MRKRDAFLLAGLCLAAVCPPGALAGPVARIRVDAPLVDPRTPEAQAQVADLLDAMAGVANRLFKDTLEVVRPEAGGNFAYSLSLVAKLGPDNPAVVLRIKRLSDGLESAAYPWIGPPTPELPSLLAHAVFLLRGSLEGAWRPSRKPPQVVDELPARLISPYAYPWSLAARGNGNLLAALGSACVELDPALRVVSEPGKSLADTGEANFALGVSVTPGGTVLLKPAQGSSLYRIPPGAAQPRRTATGIELATAPFAALPDGGVLVIDPAGRKAVKIMGKKRTDFPLFANSTEWIGFVGVGPDSTVWVYDSVLRAFRIYTLEGRLADYVLPLVDPAKPLTPLAMTVGPDGSFIVLSGGQPAAQLLKFSRNGSLLWELDSLPGLEVEKLPASGAVAADWGRGLVYLADTTGRRIIRLLDTDYCAEKGIHNEVEEKLVALRQAPDADEASGLSRVAELYESAGSILLARASWQKVLEADPGNRTAQARLRALEIPDLKRAAAALDGKARQTLSTVGPESARAAYAQALQAYEQILSRDPEDRDARSAMEALKKLFETGGPGPGRPAPLIVRDVKVPSLFPALMQYYLTHPAGTVLVSNPLPAAVENVSVRAFIPRFMDFPSESKPLPRLAPGAQAAFDLDLRFRPSVLELQEDTVVQLSIEATGTVDGREQSVSTVVDATINRNTALTWDDTRKIAAFITPNEGTVSGFARRTLDIGDSARGLSIPHKVFQAMHICDALGAYGLSYVPNPETPISKVLGNSEVIDTVHFPRVTLANRGGDCSDTTALLASLLESVGIRTAVLTTPGHIFLAFDTTEPVENAPLFSTQDLSVIARGTLWIPVETTVLRQGFMAAWASGSALVRKYSKTGPFQFLPLAQMRDSWPALPLPPSSLTIIDPSPGAVARLYGESMAGFTSALYTSRITGLTASGASSPQGRQTDLLRIRLGILHGMFGHLAEAEAAFRAVIAHDPSLVSSYINVANVRLLAGDNDGALAMVGKGLAVNPGSPLLNLLAARIYSSRGDSARAEDYLARLKSAAPELAARYAADLASGASGQRAAGPGEEPLVIWGNEK